MALLIVVAVCFLPFFLLCEVVGFIGTVVLLSKRLLEIARRSAL